MGIVKAVCVSAKKGMAKNDVERAKIIKGHGIEGDAHAGDWHRQVSLLSFEKIKEFRAKGANVNFGGFGENIVVEGIDLRGCHVGTILECGDVVLEITQIGKECHSHCSIYNEMGDCIMPREGVFAKVVRGGVVVVDDEIKIKESAPYRVWIITASDKGFKGEREDLSAPVIREIITNAGYTEAGYTLLSDDQSALENELKRVCDNALADLILTTGGTGFSARDCMPEATIAVAQKIAPGIAEAMRAQSMAVTSRAMLSRAASVIRGSTLIINLPGSPKAARENLQAVINDLYHGLEILTDRGGECGGKNISVFADEDVKHR